MNKFITVLSMTALAVFSADTFAGGQDNAHDKSKKQHEQHEKMQQHDSDGEKHRKNEHDSQSMDKQHDKKMDQERKELGKGSEQGQKSREENSRKWWKFGGTDQGDDSRRQWWKFWGDD